jgi:methanogenic corrinoid protein MtbC1
MTNMGFIIEALKTAGLRDKVKDIIGEEPVTEECAKSIDADTVAPYGSKATLPSFQLT